MSNDANATFIDFDLRIFKAGQDTYLVTAQTPGSGLATDSLDWPALSGPDFVAKLERIRDEPYSADEALFKEVGHTLFDALFRGQVRDIFISTYSQKVQTSENSYLRLRMDINEAAPEVAVLPWEFMARNDAFLCTQAKTQVTRQLLNLDYGNIKSLTVDGKPQALIVIPRGSGLETGQELETITGALEKAGIPYKVLGGKDEKGEKDKKVTVQDVADKLATGDFNILHFIGHGKFEKGDDGVLHGSLRFNTPYEDMEEDEDEEWVTEGRLQALMGNYENIKLVVLNACKGAEIAERRSGRGFIGTAPALLRAGVPAVVAMQYAIRDDVAIQFAETFYGRLTEGRWAGQVDTAVTLARNACYLTYPQDRGFATPILYLRSKDGIIFNIQRESEATDEEAAISKEQALAAACPEPPKPDDSLLHDHRYDSVDVMLSSMSSLESRYGMAQRQIDQLEKMKLENPLLAAGGMVELQIEQLEGQRKDLRREIEETGAMLRWKLYETCLEKARLSQKLAELKAEREELEAANAYVPFELKNDISDTQKRVRELDDLLKEGEKYR